MTSNGNFVSINLQPSQNAICLIVNIVDTRLAKQSSIDIHMLRAQKLQHIK